ncbi:hypothetical protein PQU94_11375 [Asticcacaulis sp. DXS10W]|uniref:Uncharacterized protein n=1 Tax=Asticcacaulis currens TaxID=2984210 RepID=A0ABT5IFB1_9CAUL|nr:hypothetical protein [Asticcacaulis currens]MDC7694882.1 hypothetical protein [Asticcacaulis currens]
MGHHQGRGHDRAGRWGWAVAVALALHALAGLLVVWLTPAPAAPELPPVEVELWPMPVIARVEPQAEDAPAPTPTQPTPRRSLPTPTQPLPRPPVTQTPPSVMERPSAPPAASETGTGVTPRAYAEGADAGRAAATRALNKRQFCIQQRNDGRPMDKDCPVSPPKEVVLPLKPPETRPTQLCLAAREREWQKYREGRGAYPGLRDMVSGKKKCRQGWDD